MKLELKKPLHLALLLLIIVSCGRDDDRINNGPPVIEAQIFTASESITDTEIIGNLKAEDPNGDALTFKISIDRDGLFEVNESGALSLLKGKSLDFETSKEHKFTVGVTDGKGIYLAVVTVVVIDVDEPSVAENQPPTIDPQAFEVREDISDANIIATVQAEDSEDNLVFSITTNDNGLFKITEDGALSLVDGETLDFESSEQHTITISVFDGTNDAVEAEVTLTVTDIFESTVEDPEFFVTTWRTTNDVESIEIGTDDNLTYDYSIDWGDGQIEQITGGTPPSHTYETAGTYTVAVKGSFPAIKMGVSPDDDKLLSIEQWGKLQWEDLSRAFISCENMQHNALDAPDLSLVTDLTSMFEDAVSFNGNIGNWDVSNVTNMTDMFRDATSFDQDLDNWDVSSVVDMKRMFRGATSFNKGIGSWNVSLVINMRDMFRDATAFNQDLSGWDVGAVTDMSGMFSDAPAFNQDLSTWDVSAVMDMSLMFFNAISFNQDLSAWDVGRVINMAQMFLGAEQFNGDIVAWNVSSVTDMSNMFQNATAFNQNIGGWDVGLVTDMSNMFNNATVFNQDLNNWNVSLVTNMANVFRNANLFDQDLGNWNVSSVTDMSGMFSGAGSFNKNIAGWDVGSVTDMRNMFANANNFNQDIGSWNVSSVTNMRSMFTGNNAFNQDISGWNVSSVENMASMFSNANAFDQNIGSWNVGSVTDMSSMFSSNHAFNQDISGWDVSSVTDMSNMFSNASVFDQNLGTWDLRSIADMSGMLNNSGISLANYDGILTGWVNNMNTPDNITLGALSLTYCATIEHDFLTNNKGWTITGDSVDMGCP